MTCRPSCKCYGSCIVCCMPLVGHGRSPVVGCFCIKCPWWFLWLHPLYLHTFVHMRMVVPLWCRLMLCYGYRFICCGVLVGHEWTPVVTGGLSFTFGKYKAFISLIYIHQCARNSVLVYLNDLPLVLNLVNDGNSRVFTREARSQCTFPSVRIVS